MIGPPLKGNATLDAAQAARQLLENGKGKMPPVGQDWTRRARTRSSATFRRTFAVAVRAELSAYPVPWYRGRVASWITTVDHKRIGILYLVTCLVFFGMGGILALLMRTQLAHANEKFLTATPTTR